MSYLTTFNQLKTQFGIKNFALKTVRQINKDLNGLSTAEVIFTNSKDNLTNIIKQLTPIIDDLIKNSQLQQFIYQVDLPEKQWLEFLNQQNIDLLCHQIIIREAQKVYLRQIFKA